jgi:Ca-activated chloride channel family protein
VKFRWLARTCPPWARARFSFTDAASAACEWLCDSGELTKHIAPGAGGAAPVLSGDHRNSGGRTFRSNPRKLLLFPFKLAWRIADNSFVQKSAVIAGVTMALSAATLLWIGEWPAGWKELGAESGAGSSGFVVPAEADGGGATGVSPTAASLVLPVGSGNFLAAPGYTIHHEVPEVRLQFTVADEQGRTVQNLTPSDIQVLDDQVPVRHFNDFTHDNNLPLRLGVLLDTSDSVGRVLAEEKLSALHFLQRVMRPQSDRAFILAFGADIRIWQTSTADREQLMNAVDRSRQPGWGTRFYDAVYAACNEQLTHAGEDMPVHRALIVLSDGDDTLSFRDLRDVVSIAQRGEIQVYTISLHNQRPATRSDLVLQRLADESGGRSYVVPSSKELDGVFGALEEELRTQYYVSFSPQQDSPGFHSLQVEVRAPQKVVVHARQGYYAVAQ